MKFWWPLLLAKSDIRIPKCTKGEGGSTSLWNIPKNTIFDGFPKSTMSAYILSTGLRSHSIKRSVSLQFSTYTGAFLGAGIPPIVGAIAMCAIRCFPDRQEKGSTCFYLRIIVLNYWISELTQDAEGKLLKESETKETVAESAWSQAKYRKLKNLILYL